MVNFNAIEQKWQNRWEEEKAFEVKETKKKKFYALEMFPYPSGTGLHIGHAFNFTITDIISRFKRLNGFNVLYPVGYDSFGLPAENAAIKAKKHPKEYTEAAIKNFIKQQKKLGFSYDWSRLVSTSSPDYYKWDQWIFLEMYKKGLAYKKNAPVNWCSKCNTVLANEQVHDGKCWRHETTDVEVKNLNQWFLKTTAYADELYEGIKDLKGWPEDIKKLQKNWIGKSNGTEINFEIETPPHKEGTIGPTTTLYNVFTTRPDTLYGVTFLVISAQHPKLMELVTSEQENKVKKFTKKLNSVSAEDIDKLEKEGVFTGSYAIHPLTNKKIPVYAGNFVLASYGSGMVMAVPAHDQRDYEFAKKYNIPIKVVISPENKTLNEEDMTKAYQERGILVNSEQFNKLHSEKAKEKITKYLEKQKKGKKTVNFRLKDWLISRQRFWGTPIPIIHCEKCGEVPDENLPVTLPENIILKAGKNPLETCDDFVNVKCPKCNGNAKRETDTMDTFTNSSWYYLRYADSTNEKQIFDKKKIKYWCPVDFYIGGREHACMHLIYIRFYTKFLRDLKLLNFDEPSINQFNQGMVHAEDGRKMSKSYGNAIDPLTVIKGSSADALRLFLVSVANPDKDFSWNTRGLESNHRFISKIYDQFNDLKIGESSKKTEHRINNAIKKVTKYIEEIKYNLAIIEIKNLFNTLENEISKKDYESAIKLLSPFCPHIAEEIWEKMGNKELLSTNVWPKYEENKINIELDAEDELIFNTIKDIQNISKFIKSKPKKVIISVSEEWKYKTIKRIKKEMETDFEISRIMKKVMDKDHAKEISKLVPQFIKNPKKLPEILLSQEIELKVLQKNISEFKDKFDLEIEIKSNDPKAMPGKPAILFE
ncbi:leucine--tRNA ligase [Candidatus Woesearchaeota archaeon]|jgi:leucyl-tRNA synthetase|nr:leucine--tRNA ligase [Candidatus Woesearchaeota archaeon]MBT4835465.1 leucine--tRNA ligase [Candidatus Woesearchaeota archaeon]MBT6734843.1 leucine--tRNA ligase [Candidatus Woesearchaeota archaeon]MBT7169642.1 leucine--tRNA ligase [Candidatus Woesearchaeota archaeon]MBT7474600.1 leucine--tRNA ligase [Candidatus Woesearchaeota archaeon]